MCFFQLAQLIVNAGGVAAIVDYIGESKGNVRLPGIMTLGFIAAHSENLAMAVIVSKVQLQKLLIILKFLQKCNNPKSSSMVRPRLIVLD